MSCLSPKRLGLRQPGEGEHLLGGVEASGGLELVLPPQLGQLSIHLQHLEVLMLLASMLVAILKIDNRVLTRMT